MENRPLTTPAGNPNAHWNVWVEVTTLMPGAVPIAGYALPYPVEEGVAVGHRMNNWQRVRDGKTLYWQDGSVLAIGAQLAENSIIKSKIVDIRTEKEHQYEPEPPVLPVIS